MGVEAREGDPGILLLKEPEFLSWPQNGVEGSGERLASQPWGPRFNPQNCYIRPGVMARGCKPQGGRGRQVGAKACPLSFLGESQAPEGACLREGKAGGSSGKTRGTECLAHLAHTQAAKEKIELLWKLSSLHLRKFSAAPFSLL